MTLDKEYQAKALAYNQARASGFFNEKGATWQSAKHAAIWGFASGAYYGSAIGVARAVYGRQVRLIPRTAIPLGLAYSGALFVSACYRMDV